MKKYDVAFKATYFGHVIIEAETKEEAEEKVIDEIEDDTGFFIEKYAYEDDLECEALPVEEDQ